MSEKYAAVGKLTDTLMTAPNGQQEVVLLYPIPKRLEMPARAFVNNVAAGCLEHGQLVFTGKNGKAEYELVGADADRNVLLLDLLHDNVYEIEA